MPGIQYSKRVFITCFLVITGILVVLANDFETHVGNMFIRVRGRSGNIEVGRKGANKSDIVFIMDSLEEVDANGREVGRGKRGHSFKTFANKNFTVRNATNTTYQNLKCKSFESSGFLEGPNATLTITYYIFMESGEINVGENEVGEVKRGSLKWSIQVENWQFCGPGGDTCQSGNKPKNGENLFFTFTVKSKIRPKKRKRKTPGKGIRKRLERFDIGDNSTMELSQQIQIDGKWINMTEGYPKIEERGNKIMFTYHIPKFQNISFYDPTVSGYSVPSEDSEEGPTTPENTATKDTAPIHIAFLTLAMVFGAFLNN